MLKIAAEIRKDGRLLRGRARGRKHAFASHEKIALTAMDLVQRSSGQQELIENIINELI